jgi:hypothetical protein
MPIESVPSGIALRLLSVGNDELADCCDIVIKVSSQCRISSLMAS